MDIFMILSIVFGLSFFIAYLYTARQLKVTTQNLAEAVLLYLSSIEQDHSEEIQVGQDGDKVHKESFIKFLSDSRDWAYDYIETTQKTISRFIQEVEPELEYYKRFGIVVEGMVSPHDKALKKVLSEISELRKLLPEESDDRR